VLTQKQVKDVVEKVYNDTRTRLWEVDTLTEAEREYVAKETAKAFKKQLESKVNVFIPSGKKRPKGENEFEF
jgi:hypothetical protein